MAKKSVSDSIEQYKAVEKYLQDEIRYYRDINDLKSAAARESELMAERQREINNLLENSSSLTKDQQKYLKDLTDEQRKAVENEKNINAQLAKGKKYRQTAVDLTKQLSAQLKIGWRYLQDQDKIIKSTNLNLGMSGAKAAAMRDSFNKSAGYVAMLGGNLADVATIMEGYANETGRAHVLSGEMVQNIADIGRGTGLSVAEATRLGAQFELMGLDAKATMDYVQGVVDTSERMGVNTTKVLKVVNDNFKRLNTYTFQQGVKGFAEMAMYAEKFKIDINQALNAADVARSLEGAIELSAQLQIMGGEFAKTDPFELLYLSRNDPAKMQERLADMTKGLVSFRKVISADGKTVFEKFISPADRDRIAAVEKSMNMEAGSMVVIAERQAEIQKMRNNMGGMGFSAEVKEAVEGAAKFNSETGKFQVKLGTSMVNIRDLTKEQGETFIQEQVLLKDRAKQALTFDESFKATINSLKTALLPLLDKVNKVLAWLAPSLDKLGEISGKGNLLKAAGILLLGAGALKSAAWALSKGASNWVATGNMFKGTGGKAATGGLRGFMSGGGTASAIPLTGKGSSGLAQQRAGIGAGAASKGAGISKMGTGVAAAGMGAGIMLAAKGIGELAEKMKELDGTQIWALPVTMLALSASFWALSPAIVAAGAAGTAGAIGLVALGAAVVGIGFGINLATKGIGAMAEGLGSMIESSKDAGPAMLQVGLGIGAISLAMMGFTAGAAGFLVFAATMKTLSKHAPAMAVVGDAFKNINAVLSGSKDDFIAVENAVKSISGANVKGGGYFAELSNLLKKPLQVEFANNGKLSMTNDITLEIDGNRFMHKVYNPEVAIQMHESLRTAK